MSKEKEILDDFSSKFDVKVKTQRDRRAWVSIKKTDLLDISAWLKEQGFTHLSSLSVTDWIDDDKYELTYHLWSYKDNILITLKTKINRKNPVIKSVSSVWGENAQIHEREMHELFGVKFEGNNDLSPLFLEDWKGVPPFKKDFDWRKYVREEFYDKNNERESGYYD
ncbi:NADH-quinone oxidoreductase subunit C [Thermococci archaeon]|nr:MAG: NADH-quinone oxidoreductase subunit C [Thermoplasmata archaeon]RLF37225.1 MAG: NADH-quinone oxidoreductase subunit C [Thermoplasmata archaeon]RLF95222.1 MAG: NADH-quinone oxidoreductase subunit C [Thermococci archaeon]RLF97244.1 MAG: NADH-quinone oxidoreductase subunit C [Thermococci archaeon]